MEQKQAQPAFDNSKLFVWFKGLETKVNNLSRQVEVIKSDFLTKNKSTKEQLKTFSKELIDLKRSQEQMQAKMDLIIQELKKTAGVEDVMTIKKYLEYWNPMTFVTHNDLDRAIEAKKEVK